MCSAFGSASFSNRDKYRIQYTNVRGRRADLQQNPICLSDHSIYIQSNMSLYVLLMINTIPYGMVLCYPFYQV